MLKTLAVPEVLTIRQERPTLSESDLGQVKRIIEVLESAEINRLIDEGKLTLALIKPQANQGKNLPSNDQEAAGVLLGEIRDSIPEFKDAEMLAIVIRLSREEAEEFYASKKEEFLGRFSEKEPTVTLWESNVGFMCSGPSTFVLLYLPSLPDVSADSNEGDAVKWWREKIGHTFGSRAAPGTIRNKYAIDDNLPNNIVHGSDSKEAVRRELQVLVGHLKKML